MSKEFWEKYKHPKWQERRLEIMKLAGFVCQDCGSKDKTLNVHHKRYIKNRDPWEYEDHQLECLCEACHKEHHGLAQRLKEVLDLPGVDFAKVIGFAASLADQHLEFDFPKKYHPASYEELEGFIAGMLYIPPFSTEKLIARLKGTDDLEYSAHYDSEFVTAEYVHGMKHFDFPCLGPVVDPGDNE